MREDTRTGGPEGRRDRRKARRLRGSVDQRDTVSGGRWRARKRGQTRSAFRTKSDPIAQRMTGPVIPISIYAELGEVFADMVDDLFELAIELEGFGDEAVVSAG
jgi:hypothetical protein